MLWLAGGLAGGVAIGLARSAGAAGAGEYVKYGQYALLARHLWFWLTAHAAAGLALAAGAIAPLLVARGGRVSQRWAVIGAALIGAGGLAVAVWRRGPDAVYRVRDTLAPSLPHGGAAAVALCAGWFFGVGLVLSPVLAWVVPRWLAARGAARLVKAAAGGALALLVALGAAAAFAPPRALNVLLITLDAQRADHLHCYGYHRDTSPNIDALAARGTLFLDASANATWTLPSVASIMTGKLPVDHGATTLEHRLKPSEVTLAEVLQAHGYRTGSVTASQFISPSYGTLKGFRWSVGGEFKDNATAIAHFFESPPWVTPAGLKFIRGHRHQPFFLWLHYLRPHDPYFWRVDHHYLSAAPRDLPVFLTYDWLMRNRAKITPKQLEEVIALYDGHVANADHHIGRIIAELERLRLTANTLVILSADHGEEFGQHGHFGHLQTYEDVLRVPLIMVAPGRIPAGRRVAAPVQLVDIFPTVLDLCGIRHRDPGLRGQSLVPLLVGGRRHRPADVAAFLMATRGGHDSEVVRSLKRGRWKLIENMSRRTIELYDLATDPGERHNLAGRGLAVEQELRAALSGYRQARAGRRVALTEETKARLRALGYLR